MRVLIDTTYAERAPFSGTGVYIRELCAALEQRDEVDVVRVANHARRPPAGGGAGSVRNGVADVRWSAIELPRLASRHGAELIHHPLPARAPVARVPQVVTLHDLAFERLPQCFDRRFRSFAHLSHSWAARGADGVISVSETTAADARELWGVPGERISVASLGPGQALNTDTDDRAFRSFFLYVGDDEPRKNLATLLSAYERYRDRTSTPMPLILAGSAGARAPGAQVERSPTAERLAELYCGAVALIQPSLYEGFGLTALEAMGAGAPVLAARSPGLEEVCGDAALWADPGDPDSFASAMLALQEQPEVGEEVAERGRRRVRSFSWAACAEAHLRAYSLAVSRA